ncbi:hypothetical protein V1634_20475 [Plantactinospora veratri]|uniref:Uncharacterized protein n=1 Tax=Plantactinospora veratri TaxID=1436122 RepID=A0ABU7SGY4_9ACTN
MTAEPVGPASRRPWSPDPVRQRLANHTIEDVRLLLTLAKPFEARLRVRDIAA